MRLKLVDLNVFEGGVLFEAMLSFLLRENADILTLQEVYNGVGQSLTQRFRSLSVLSEALSGYSYFYSPELLHAREEGKFDIGNAIFSRYPIIATETIFFGMGYSECRRDVQKTDFSRDPKNIQHAEVQLGNKIIHVFNLHGIWGFNGADNPSRLKMGEAIVNAVKNKQPAILAGDFNLDPTTQVVANIEKHMTSVFSRELKTTFNMKRKTKIGYSISAVDMVFVSREIIVVDKFCPQIDVSDHMPLVCVFDL